MAHTILLVDDERDLVALWREYLAARGHDAHVAPTVRAAAAALLALRPTIVIVDFQLPDGTANDVLAALPAPKPHVIVCSGRGDDLPTQLLARVDQVLGKPFRLDQLDDAIRRAG